MGAMEAGPEESVSAAIAPIFYFVSPWSHQPPSTNSTNQVAIAVLYMNICLPTHSPTSIAPHRNVEDVLLAPYRRSYLRLLLELSQNLLTLCSCRLEVANHVESTFWQIITLTVDDLLE